MQPYHRDFNVCRRMKAAAMFHHGRRDIADLAKEFRVNCAAVGAATREFPKDNQSLHIYQQIIGGC